MKIIVRPTLTNIIDGSQFGFNLTGGATLVECIDKPVVIPTIPSLTNFAFCDTPEHPNITMLLNSVDANVVNSIRVAQYCKRTGLTGFNANFKVDTIYGLISKVIPAVGTSYLWLYKDFTASDWGLTTLLLSDLLSAYLNTSMSVSTWYIACLYVEIDYTPLAIPISSNVRHRQLRR